MRGHRDAAGFVLVGGRSSRMGVDKALLPYRGMPLASYIAHQMAEVAHPVSLVGDPLRHGALGFPVVADERPGSGPVGAIVTALRATNATFNLVTSCDVPGVTSDLFVAMLDHIQGTDLQCLVPVTPDGREQVLCAVYRRDAAERMDSAETRLRLAVRRLRVEYWPIASYEWTWNVNTPEDWAAFRAREAR